MWHHHFVVHRWGHGLVAAELSVHWCVIWHCHFVVHLRGHRHGLVVAQFGVRILRMRHGTASAMQAFMVVVLNVSMRHRHVQVGAMGLLPAKLMSRCVMITHSRVTSCPSVMIVRDIGGALRFVAVIEGSPLIVGRRGVVRTASHVLIEALVGLLLVSKLLLLVLLELMLLVLVNEVTAMLLFEHI